MKKIDWFLVVCVVVISLFGLLMIYSASYVWAEYKFDNPYKFVRTQTLFLIVGYILMMIISNINYKKYFALLPLKGEKELDYSASFMLYEVEEDEEHNPVVMYIEDDEEYAIAAQCFSEQMSKKS